jgi:hypothetical protein
MVLVTSPEGVLLGVGNTVGEVKAILLLLGAGNTVGEVKAILQKGAQEYADRRKSELINDHVQAMASTNGVLEYSADMILKDARLLREKTLEDVRRFIDTCTMEEVE